MQYLAFIFTKNQTYIFTFELHTFEYIFDIFQNLETSFFIFVWINKPYYTQRFDDIKTQ